MFNDKVQIKEKKMKGKFDIGNFPSHCSKEKIYFKTYSPDKEAKAHLIIIHDISEHHGRYLEIVSFLEKNKLDDLAISWIDLKGHGLSSGARSYVESFNDYSRDLQHYLSSIVNSEIPTFVLGHGVGSLVALNNVSLYSEDFSKRIAGLILTNPCIRLKMEFPRYLGKMDESIFGSLTKKVRVPYHIHGLELTQDEVKAMAYDSDPLVNHFISNSLLQEVYSTSKKLRQISYYIDVPTFVVIGWRDYFCDHDMTKLFIKGGDKRLFDSLELPSFGHDLFNELNRDKFFQALYNWIKNKIR